MKIVISVVLLIVSLALVIKGGDIFVSSATDIAKKAKIPQIIFGATIVSLATTLPELIIGIISSLDGTTGLAVGNAVGSASCNIGLTCGISFLLMKSDLSRGGFLKYYLNILVVLILTVFGLWLNIPLWQGFVLIALAILFFVVNYLDAKQLENTSSKKEQTQTKTKPIWLLILLFILGAACIGGGSYLLVQKVEELSSIIGISEQFVGITIIAIGTSLPELITVFKALKTKSPYLAIGNIIGSNILNLTLILGASRLSAWGYKMQISPETAFVSLPILCLLSLFMIVPILLKKKTYKWQGVVMLLIYIAYIVGLVLNVIFKFV